MSSRMVILLLMPLTIQVVTALAIAIVNKEMK
jgi:hypothetical protein